MNKMVVIYNSKYGSTKQYGEWIAEELKADLLNGSDTSLEKLLQYETIILGGGLYAGGINGAKIISKNFNKLKDKNIIVFTVGLSVTNDPEIFKAAIEKNFTEEMRDKIKVFNLRGGIDYHKLSFIHKIMMGALKKNVSKKQPEDLSDDEKLMLETYGDKIDFSDKNTIKPLVDWAKKYNI